MLHLTDIELRHFKGIPQLTCRFDDLTVLAGLNNAGKTSVLEACSLIISCISKLDAANKNRKSEVDLRDLCSKLGLSIDWLHPFGDFNRGMVVRAGFSTGASISITASSLSRFLLTIESLDEQVTIPNALKAEFILPPGIIASKEDLQSGPQFDELVRQGKGPAHWRNSLWWPVQRGGGLEAFEPVKRLVEKYFPDVRLLSPTLDGSTNPPQISIRYHEKDSGSALDISQSGAGIKTFLTLARMLEQSDAQVLLLDEPDSHLHASQQAVVADLLNEVAADKQVIISTHSPELLVRLPAESIRWLDRMQPVAVGGIDHAQMLDKLGVAADTYVSAVNFPEIIVYVEGKDDRPIIEAIVRRCRASTPRLPHAMIVQHKDGRFDAEALRAISQFSKAMNRNCRIIGIRDLDWDYSCCASWRYNNLPDINAMVEANDDYLLLTLPVKEMENAFCDATVLYDAFKGFIPAEQLEGIVTRTIMAPNVIEEWKWQLLPRMRHRMPTEWAAHTKEEKAERLFSDWSNDVDVCRRFVAGKQVLRQIKADVHAKFKQSLRLNQAIAELTALPSTLEPIVDAIYSQYDH